MVLRVQPHREDTVHSLILIGPARRHALNFVYLFNILKMDITMDKKLYMRVPLFCRKVYGRPLNSAILAGGRGRDSGFSIESFQAGHPHSITARYK